MPAHTELEQGAGRSVKRVTFITPNGTVITKAEMLRRRRSGLAVRRKVLKRRKVTPGTRIKRLAFKAPGISMTQRRLDRGF